MTRTSPAEVRGLFRRLVQAAEAAGVDVEGWRLEQQASPASWRIGGSQMPNTGAFLGYTARDAAVRLTGMVTALEMVPAREGVR